jgi:hypothetical protein
MLSQLQRAPTVRDVDNLPRPDPPYAWACPGERPRGAAPAREEFSLASLLRGERRTVALERNRRAREQTGAGARADGAGEDGLGQRAPTVLRGVGEGGEEQHLKVLYPGGKAWDGARWVVVPPAMVTVRRPRNLNFGLNRALLRPGAAPARRPRGEGAPGGPEEGGPAEEGAEDGEEVELVVGPGRAELKVFHHVGQLAAGHRYWHAGVEYQVLHGGSYLPPDRRLGVVEAGPLPEGQVIGGPWRFGDLGAYGADGKLLGRAHPFRDGAGQEELDGTPMFARVCRAGPAPAPAPLPRARRRRRRPRRQGILTTG